VRAHARACVCVYVRTCVCVHVCSVHTYVCVLAFMCVYARACVCTRVCMCSVYITFMSSYAFRFEKPLTKKWDYPGNILIVMK